MPIRETAYCEVRVYDPGHGAPYAANGDYGFGAYDVLGQCWKRGTPDRLSDRQQTTQWVDGLGLINRVRLVAKDTRLANFTTSPATWEETLPLGGAYRAYRLVQYDTTAGVTYLATSTYALTEDPEVAFSLSLEDTPPDWDEVTYPPFVRVQFGGVWGIELRKAGAALVRLVAGNWDAVMDLPTPGRGAGYADLDESWFYLRCLEGSGKIAVSSDFGTTYQVYEDPFGSALTVGAAQWKVAGQGGVLMVGMHQLVPAVATFRGGAWSTLQTRTAPTVSLAGRYTGNVALSDVGSGSTQQAQYQAILTPRSQACLPFAVWHSCALRAVSYRIAPTLTTLGDDYETPWTNALVAARISKPAELDAATATLTLRLNAFSEFDLEDPGWRYRVIEIVAGYNLSDDTQELYTVFTGYITNVELVWSDEWGAVTATLSLANASFRFKRSPWSPLEVYQFGGMTPNAAANLILQARGLDASYAAWDAIGSVRPLGLGTPEEPFEITRPNELPWETLKRIFGYECLEPVPLDDGTFSSVVKDYVAPTVSLEYTPRSDADARKLLKSIRHGVDYTRSASAVIVYGGTEDGSLVIRGGRDTEAELDPGCGRFVPFRDQIIEQVSGRPDVGTILGRVQALGRMYLPLKYEAEAAAPLHLGLTRRQRVAIRHCEGVGIPDETEFGIWTLDHEITAEDGVTTMTTTAGLRCIGSLTE